MMKFRLSNANQIRLSMKALLFTLFFLAAACIQLLAQAPTTGASNFSVTNHDGDRLRVNWTRGNGSRVLVVASTSPTFGGLGIPADGIDYTANNTFGSGNEIGTGNFVVYESTG